MVNPQAEVFAGADAVLLVGAIAVTKLGAGAVTRANLLGRLLGPPAPVLPAGPFAAKLGEAMRTVPTMPAATAAAMRVFLRIMFPRLW